MSVNIAFQKIISNQNYAMELNTTGLILVLKFWSNKLLIPKYNSVNSITF